MKRLTLRLSDTLHEALKELSLEEQRSLHGQIVYLLKEMLGGTKHNRSKKELDDVTR
jgi:hypothetical protein